MVTMEEAEYFFKQVEKYEKNASYLHMKTYVKVTNNGINVYFANLEAKYNKAMFKLVEPLINSLIDEVDRIYSVRYANPEDKESEVSRLLKVASSNLERYLNTFFDQGCNAFYEQVFEQYDHEKSKYQPQQAA